MHPSVPIIRKLSTEHYSSGYHVHARVSCRCDLRLKISFDITVLPCQSRDRGVYSQRKLCNRTDWPTRCITGQKRYWVAYRDTRLHNRLAGCTKGVRLRNRASYATVQNIYTRNATRAKNWRNSQFFRPHETFTMVNFCLANYQIFPAGMQNISHARNITPA